jgi:hypothetical protein
MAAIKLKAAQVCRYASERYFTHNTALHPPEKRATDTCAARRHAEKAGGGQLWRGRAMANPAAASVLCGITRSRAPSLARSSPCY